MSDTRRSHLSVVIAVALLLGALVLPMFASISVFAQDTVNADTPTPEPATVTPVPTLPPTLAPTLAPTATSGPVGPTPTPRPVPIPEPVTVILFGTGLAALSATLATRRKKDN